MSLDAVGQYRCVCGKEFTRAQSFNGHKAHCKEHQLQKYGSLDLYRNAIERSHKKTAQTIKNKQLSLKQEDQLVWLNEQHLCETCGIIMTKKYGSGRFCSKSCSSVRSKSLQSRRKTSLTLKSTYIKQMELEPLKKEKYLQKHQCKICGDIDCLKSFCRDGNKLQQIKTFIKYFNFPQECLGTNRIFQEWDNFRQKIFDLYWVQDKSSGVICKQFGYKNVPHFTYKILKYLNIQTKTMSQGQQSNLLSNESSNLPKNPVYKQGWHTTWDNKQVYLRSSYEFDFASMLDTMQQEYFVEKIRIKYFDTIMNKSRVSIPDFYLPKYNLIIEVKSNYTLDVQNMKDKRRSYIENNYKFMLWLDKEFVDLDSIIDDTTAQLE